MGRLKNKHDHTNIIEGTRKRNKKVVFDPSDNNIPKRRRKKDLTNSDVNLTIIEEKSDTSLQDGFESVNVTSGVCSVCRKQKYDKFISCSDCCNKAHISCLDKNVGILRMKPDNTWQCPFCKTCVFCEETADSGVLTVCKICSDAYHALCHTPKLKPNVTASSDWICSNCKDTSGDCDYISEGIIKIKKNLEHLQKMKDNIIKNEDNLNLQIKQEDIKSDPDEYIYSEDYGYKINPIIPDISEWTSDDVYTYFLNLFPEDAFIFKEEKIDGLSLLLIDRQTVLENFNMDLGNALKMWKHIVQLQERRHNPQRLYL